MRAQGSSQVLLLSQHRAAATERAVQPAQPGCASPGVPGPQQVEF